MVSYDKRKKEIIIKDVVTFKDLVKTLGKDIISIDISGSIKIQSSSLLLENNSTLIIDDGNYLFNIEKIYLKENSSLILGSDIIDTIFTKVSFKNLKEIFIGKDVNLTFKNVMMNSNLEWITNSDTTLSIINSKIKFDIITNGNNIVKNVQFNNFIKSDKNIIVHNVNMKNVFDKEYLLEPNGDVTFYNGELSSYDKLLDTNKLTKPVRLIFKGTKLNGGYNFTKNENLEIIHELLLSGKIYNNSGDLICNSEIEIVDRYNNIVNTLCTDEHGHFSLWLPYYTYLNNIAKYHMPYFINNKDSKISIGFKENKSDMVIHINNKIDKDLLLLIERVDNKLENGLNEVKTGLANLLLNSEKPIKNVSPGSVVSAQGTKLTIY